MTDDLGNVNNVIRIEEAEAADVGSTIQTTSPTTEEEVEKDEAGRKPESTTSDSPPVTPSSEGKPIETQSVTSTNPTLGESEVDEGVTTPLHYSQTDLKPTRSLSPHKTQATVQTQPKPAASPTANSRSRGLLAKLLWYCSRQ